MQALRLVRPDSSSTGSAPAGRAELAQKAAAHLERVRARLEQGRSADTEKERARVKEKHKDRRLRLKGQRKEDTGGAVAYLGGEEEGEAGGGSGGGYSSDDGSEDGGGDVGHIQALALKMLQKR